MDALSFSKTKEVLILKVKMLVQTQYKNQLLRLGKTYQVPDQTAKRWHQSKIAIMINEDGEKQV